MVELADVVRNNILDTGRRIDGRDTRTVRPIMAEVGVLPRAHGSALFTRGETQSLCVATLGTGQGLWRIKHRSFVVQHQLHPAELELFDTTGRMTGVDPATPAHLMDDTSSRK